MTAFPNDVYCVRSHRMSEFLLLLSALVLSVSFRVSAWNSAGLRKFSSAPNSSVRARQKFNSFCYDKGDSKPMAAVPKVRRPQWRDAPMERGEYVATSDLP